MSKNQSKREPGKAGSGASRAAPGMIPAAIGTRLQEMYNGVLTEPVPSELADLVARLAGKTDDDGGDSGTS